MKKYIYLYLLIAFTLFMECCGNKNGMFARLDSIDSLMDTNPQEAYDSLTSMKNGIYNYSDKKDFMKYRLLEAKALNKLYRQMPTDSSFLEVVDYFDKHGTGKDKIQCHYLLGCIYRDSHDAPKAIEWYNYAIEMLESQENSDDKTGMQLLALSYGEVADLQHSQLLYAEAIKNYKQAIAYAKQCGDSVIMANNYGYMSASYTMQNMLDSAIAANELAADLYLKTGRDEDAATVLGINMANYLAKKDFYKMGKAINLYKRKSGLFNGNDIKKGREVVYYYIGEYFLNTNQLDSARFYFYKELSTGQDFNNQYSATLGLSQLYTRLHFKDSVAKYATLSSQWNDSISMSKQTEVAAKANALYSYNRYKKKANDIQHKKVKSEMIFVFVTICLLLIILLVYMVFRHKSKNISKKYDSKLQEVLQNAETTMSYIAAERKKYERLKDRNDELKRERDMAEQKSAFFQDRLISLTANKDTLQDYDAVEQKLMDSAIYKVIKEYLATGKMANDGVMRKVSDLIDHNIPTFKGKVNSSGLISEIDYDVCLLIRLHLKPSEICKLLDIDSATLSMKRKRLLMKIYGKDGSSKDFDRCINSIY